MHPEDHSQCGESTWILENLKPEPGFFVEVGAFDGVQSSNTYLFEKLGWSGLLIEADPCLAGRAQEARRAPTLCCAVGYGKIENFTINLTDRGLSGFLAGYPANHRVIPVVTLTLGRILDCLGIESVDILSIDTEGSELHVWASLLGVPKLPKIVIMEYQTCDNPPNDEVILRQMTNDGYREVHRTKYNLIFAR